MSGQASQTDGAPATPVRIALPARVNLAAADALGAQLRAAGAGPVELSAEAVERICTPAVLWLVSAIRARPDAPIRVTGASDPFTDAFSDLGLFADLMRLEFAS
ncbi:hypothetical protein GE300_07505 [Rhodobacteraceae bacterium 2CG4]|uniref:STAS domain-containing protein n=1 Tax=Halovulum marinum TaxID=2662447 RepID=A0A6L5YYS5_9RHOB|nr:hypothetical protein [Halovulum marinum]MSU89461.1 hypothetical protein [Halovulum marinum]